MKKLKRMPGEKRREQIITVARKLFAENKYQGTTMATIARAVGVTEPLIYKHFKNKKELFMIILKECHDIVASEFLSALEGEGNILALYQKFFANFMDYLQKEPDRAKICILAASVDDHEVRSEIRCFDETLEDIIIKDLIKRKTEKQIRLNVEPEAVARIFISLMIERAHLIMIEKEGNIDRVFLSKIGTELFKRDGIPT